MKLEKEKLKPEELSSMKDSFFHIYHSLLDDGFLTKEFVSCLLKWSIQLSIDKDELKHFDPSYHKEDKLTREEALEHLFNLVYMIYLDGVVEDIELEVVTKFAEKTGFQPHIVNDLLKTIVTAPYDGVTIDHVRAHLREILE